MADAFEERKKALEEDYFRRREQELIDKMRAKIATENQTANLSCPKCDGKLIEGNFEQVQIDVCEKCGGVWLDPGELQQVVQKESGGWFGRLLS